MHIYFIRHGETEFNRKHIHQHAAVPLSEHGKLQAQKTGTALKKFPITKLITSDLKRARETASIIGESLNLEAELSELFREVKRPSELFGHHHYGHHSIRAGSSILLHIRNPAWHYSDEENLFDLKKRVAQSVAYLKKLGGEHEHVAVVSHAFITNIFIKYMCYTNEVRLIDYVKTYLAAKKLHNGSISEVTYDDDSNSHTCDWVLASINDYAHLR